MSKRKNIYSILCESLINGRLPCNFELPHEKSAPNQLQFMVGAKDGIGVFHMSQSESEKIVDNIIGLLKSGETDKIASLIKENRALEIVDPLLAAIQKSKDNLDRSAVFTYAGSLAFESDDEEIVKIGIAILGLFDWISHPEIKEKMITLGLYEEFTLYVVVAAQNCENGNDIIFRIAQNVDDWGKIQAVTRLEATTDEIQDWILRHGCENVIMDIYLGLECANKGNLIDKLRGNTLDRELFNGIGIIINALIEEGPADGISEYEHAEEALLRYLQFAEKYACELEHLWQVLNVQDYVNAHCEGDEPRLKNKDLLLKICSDISKRISWRKLIMETLADPETDDVFYADNSASRLGIDVTDLILAAVKKEPIKNSTYMSKVYKKPKYAQELTTMYETILPLDQMACGMGDHLFGQTFGMEHHALELILRELQQYPNMGEPLVATALGAPVGGGRNGACRVLEEWSSRLGKPILSFSPALYEKLQYVASIEVNADTKKEMMKLLRSSGS